MDTEFEIKVLDIDVEEMKNKLEAQGFTEQPTVTFRRYVYSISDEPKMWLRLRTDGAKTTLTLKKFESDAIDGMKELEFKLDDFDTANKLVTELGFTDSLYQENQRTNFVHNGSEVEVSIDEWPKIPAYMEIEAKDETAVRELLKKLNTKSLPTTSQPTDAVYQKYGLDINAYSSLSFQKNQGSGASTFILVQMSRKPLDFSTKIYKFTSDTLTFSPFISTEAQDNRRLLRCVMLQAGFAPLMLNSGTLVIVIRNGPDTTARTLRYINRLILRYEALRQNHPIRRKTVMPLSGHNYVII